MSARTAIVTSPATASHAGGPHIPPGTASRIAEALGADLRIADLYDDVGGPVYHLMASHDLSEINEVVTALRDTEGPVLELACGSGRLTLPLLLAGHQVTGVDTSASLLAALAAQVGRLPARRAADRLTVLRQDMLTLDLDTRFEAALLGITTIGLVPPEWRPGFLRGVYRHLLPGGRFLLTVHTPDIPPGEEEINTFVIDDAVVTLIGYVEPDLTGRHVAALSIARGAAPLLVTSFVHLVTPEQLTSELVAAGFEIESTGTVRDHLGRPTEGNTLVIARRPS
ncbi:daptide-type RiPP biosynthesis methyltransferase [Streptomyces sp. NPDC007991]|uniref:daptide-type RiPP biosynthesis methyltransferase n=1 Tax=Streptomyces sp. NPDC007991 TaxID=3364803 RepID=UPI0036E6E027